MVDVREYCEVPIPELVPVAGWREIPIHDNGEELVSFDAIGLAHASFYSGNHDFSPYTPGDLPGTTTDVFIRSGFAEAIVAAEALLPPNLTLLGLDGHRSSCLQASLYRYYYDQLRTLYPEWSPQELEAETSKYVSLPSTDEQKPSPHNTGGSLDLWLLELPDEINKANTPNKEILRHSEWLPAGAPFDHGQERASLRYYEENDGPGYDAYRANRRLLYWIMKLNKIEPYPDEYWHYNFGNQMAARTSDSLHAVYGAVELDITHDPVSTTIVTGLPMGEKISPA